MAAKKQLSAEDYTVGWLCAVQEELMAALMMLDEKHSYPPKTIGYDDNVYYFGEINRHNLVIIPLAIFLHGDMSAQRTLKPLDQIFPNIKVYLFVGIGGAIPRKPLGDSTKDIHLGDVVVGYTGISGQPAVVEYDYGRSYWNHDERMGLLDQPRKQVVNSLMPILIDHEMGQSEYIEHLRKFEQNPDFKHPGLDKDILFPTDQRHEGTILSGDTVLRDGRIRDQLSIKYPEAKCIEMEPAGVMNDLHPLVIRGIVDYADSHENNAWRYYAASTAAAFAREVLYKIQSLVADPRDEGIGKLGFKTPVEYTSSSGVKEFDKSRETSCLLSEIYKEIKMGAPRLPSDKSGQYAGSKEIVEADMQSIERAVLALSEQVREPIAAQLVVEWEMLECFKEQYEKGFILGRLMVIVGGVSQAWATTCSEYFKEIWPMSGERNLEAIASVLQKAIERSESSSLQKISGGLEITVSWPYFSHAIITARGFVKDVVEFAQQLAFLTAAFRVPHNSQLCLSKCHIKSEAQGQLHISLGEIVPISSEDNCCWHPLLTGSVIAYLFPIRARNDEIGLEIPFDLMVSLADVSYVTDFQGHEFLKGYSTILVPTALFNESAQWHFMTNLDSKQRAPLKWVQDMLKDHTDDKLDLKIACSSNRIFLGCCEKIKVMLGTQHSSWASVTYSLMDKSHRVPEIKSLIAGIGLSIKGLLSITASTIIELSSNQKAKRSSESSSYRSLLDGLRDTPIILYNFRQGTNEAKKAWLVSTLSVILHLSHTWQHWHPTLVQESVTIPFAQPLPDGGEAAERVLKDAENLELHEGFTLKDLVITFWRNMEKKLEAFEDNRQKGIRPGPGKVGGWELMDVIFNDNNFRLHHVQSSNGGWPLLAEDKMVLFCSQLGDVLVPVEGRIACHVMQPGKDYMMASLACIHSLCKARRVPGCPYLQLSDRCGWRPHLPSSILSEEPVRHPFTDCQILQQISGYDLSELSNSHGSVITEKGLMEGAVVFGNLPKKLRKKPPV